MIERACACARAHQAKESRGACGDKRAISCKLGVSYEEEDTCVIRGGGHKRAISRKLSTSRESAREREADTETDTETDTDAEKEIRRGARV